MAKKKRRGKKSKSKQSVDTSSSSSASNKKSEPTKLTAKFQQIFNQVVRMYERKMYKKGLKSAQKILDKFPHHGDTHAMRGLILNSMDKKKEADVAVKKGLKYAPRSHTCWHVYGMIFRTRHNYAQAAKCFRVALMNDKDNSMILRDMSILQLQIRQLEEFSKSRQKMLKAKSNSKENWLGLAVSKHLLGEHETALSVLKSYRGTQEDFKEPTYAGGEIVMYENMILREFASPERVLKHLDENAFAVKGKMEWVIAKSRVLLRLGRFEDALKGYDRLLSINPENYSFHRGYIYAKLNRKPCHEMSSTTGALDVDYVGTDLPLNLDKDFTSKERETIRELYATTMMKRFPKARAVKIIQILHSTESNFEKVVKKDIMRALLRAQTSYFTVLKTIYRQEPDEMISKQKMEFVTKHLEGLLEEMEDDPPHLKLHAFILLSQHYDLKGDFENALRIADSAISHTPTYVEAYMNKARVLKHQNKLEDAADVMDQARTLDLQDRFVNCKAVKYFLRANKPKRAKEVATLFLVDEKGEIKRTMEDMQTYWFETEAGESYMRLGKYGKALKYFCTALSHFEDIKNDQFDFHQYCMRKVTMRAWVRMLRLADNGLKSHKFNLRASFGAIQCYIKLSEMKDIEKKEMFERDREVDEKKKKKKKNKEDENGKVDEDPHGEKLASVKSPLDEAWNNVMTMNKFAPLDVRTNIAAFEVSIRQKRFLVALRSLSRMSQDEVSKRKDTFLGALQSAKFDNATVKSVVDQEVKRIFS